uniref:HMG box domain-containing protein n=1 Tax=Cyclophora tenuis TaxID=216820 RepID=A0A7S1D0A0_CYCTE|mmetsp:Transcript_14941/g.25348  ORF Transcript_14941/g.25348 Transcript_14941/m.25348 type:complete len:216 (+) Transcript_14941:156-803(+)|eukprot:CAMPEP_0116553190 /NCGR_PEP_ID=MMETSP0397-20121206/6916_1 /TAXON_ID=216820 /ORGANISM="Cyclophora tenuis, Strain ECT3854" /LENGTH=215 /DNA_ID=CAMNT_0004078247 /DNA_START=109 /DNA_END=756 /DNA_ORIENTATION=+
MAPSDYDDEDDEGVEDDEDVEEEEEEDADEEEEEELPKKKRSAPKKKGRDPNKPKRNMSAFFLYSQANRAQVKEDNPEAPFGDIAKILSAQYKALGPKEKEKWEKKAAKDKKRYQREMENYDPPEEYEESSRKGKKAKKDPNKPKRNMSAYFLYSVAVRPQVKEDNPDASFGQIAKLISSQYKQLGGKEREKWERRAAEDKERYEAEMEEYNASR